MRILFLSALGFVIVYFWQKRIPRPADRVSERWLKDNVRAEGADLEVESRPVMRLVKAEGASAPKAYSRPAGN